MKNLKKAGAVALAAVMAVTFAPVASLNAFANEKVEKDGTTIKQDNAVLDETGTYKIDAANLNLSIGADAEKGTYTIDLNGKDVAKIAVPSVDVRVVITDSDADKNDTYGSVGTIELGSAAQTKTSVKPTLEVDRGTMTAIDLRWGDLDIKGGTIKKVTTTVGTQATNTADGAQEIPGTVNTDVIKITGGEFYATWLDDAAGTDDDLAPDSKNSSQIVKIDITGGVFADNPAKYTYYPSTKADVATDKVSPIAKTTPVALLADDATTYTNDKYAVGNDEINGHFDAAKIKAGIGYTTGNDPIVTVENGPVVLKDMASGITAQVVSLTNKGEKDGKSLSATAKSGVSVYHEVREDKTNSSEKATVIDTYYFGDGPIGGYLGNNEVGFDDETATKVNTKTLMNDAELAAAVENSEEKEYKTTGTFTNGGDTLEVDVDDKKYVVGETNIKNKAKATTVKAVKVNCLKSADGDCTLDAITNAAVSADSKYSVLSGKSTNGKCYEIAMAKHLDVDGAPAAHDNGPDVAMNANDIVVEQLGTSGIEDGANGILAIENVNANKKVTTKDVTLPLSKDADTWYVGDKANQLASGSSIGRTIRATYTKAGSTALSNIDTVGAGGALTFYQGGITMPAVLTDKNPGAYGYNKDSVDTAIDFVDGAELGITRTPNYTVNEFGVSSVSSVDVTVGAGQNVPTQVRRFKNIYTGVHIYTINADEIANLTKSGEWTLENANAFKVLPWNTTVDGAVQVRRYMNVHTGEFLYSTDASEQANLDKDTANWLRQGIAFCGVAKDKGYAITRVLNTIKGDHVYSTSYTGEVEPLLKQSGYKVDGWPFYAVDIPANEK